ncbi:GNAT family acetyltransferase Nat4 [Aspergillus steynii IBT 23096]|uniref:N-alpha-acetyltransferase 40 n=1 Tax=Aspergillus steynii IBT 23096 TaxID=1392250 RepID=A0A2I2GNV6_9EURO|nr:GNAT family acetyltransferase Nat4 [Aspergillus steynii IBT 23096]PLB54556.1 GNAT family acetyltransferase Nat4 [Aspergillus steynii IBT 23096]
MPSSVQEGRVTKPKPKRSSQRNSRSLPLVERTNELPLDQLLSLYVPPEELTFKITTPTANEAAQEKQDHTSEGLDYILDIYTADSIPTADFEACFKLIELTSSNAYTGSSFGWSPSKKVKEMRLPDMRYMILRRGPRATDKDGSAQPLGFLSFMVTYEDGKEVLYCYEIHLSPDAQGQGLGEQLMRRFANIGKRIGLEKAMLTVFKSNKQAVRFYEKLGYVEDEFSPRPRRLRNGTVKEPDYRIMSKSLRADGQ